MNFNIKKCAAAMLATAAALCATAQNTQSGYFLDDYAYRFLSNPALAPSHGKLLVGIPGISNLNVNMRGNLALTDVIYNVNGKTTTFMNPEVSAAEAMGNLSDMNRLGFDIRENILSFGFGMLGGYSTINISARANVNTRLPKSIFSFLKEGVTNDTYQIDGLKARAIGYGEISLGHSRNITNEIRVGANVKVLLGVGSVKADLDRATLALNRDSWDITTNASIHTSLKGYTYETKYSEDTHREYVSGLDGSFKPINGFGMALDLGATYAPKVLKDWEFSAALLDLGFIKWDNDLYATTNGDRSFQSSIYNFSADDNAPNSFSNEWDRMRNSLEELYQLEDAGDTGGYTQALNATINLGASYTLPVYRRLKFGLLNTTRIAGSFSWTDFRLSANVSPVKNISVGLNGNAGTLGCGFGWMANLRIPYAGIQLYVAQDNFFAKTAKQGVPLASNASISLGLNVIL